MDKQEILEIIKKKYELLNRHENTNNDFCEILKEIFDELDSKTTLNQEDEECAAIVIKTCDFFERLFKKSPTLEKVTPDILKINEVSWLSDDTMDGNETDLLPEISTLRKCKVMPKLFKITGPRYSTAKQFVTTTNSMTRIAEYHHKFQATTHKCTVLLKRCDIPKLAVYRASHSISRNDPMEILLESWDISKTAPRKLRSSATKSTSKISSQSSKPLLTTVPSLNGTKTGFFNEKIATTTNKTTNHSNKTSLVSIRDGFKVQEGGANERPLIDPTNHKFNPEKKLSSDEQTFKKLLNSSSINQLTSSSLTYSSSSNSSIKSLNSNDLNVNMLFTDSSRKFAISKSSNIRKAFNGIRKPQLKRNQVFSTNTRVLDKVQSTQNLDKPFVSSVANINNTSVIEKPKEYLKSSTDEEKPKNSSHPNITLTIEKKTNPPLSNQNSFQYGSTFSDKTNESNQKDKALPLKSNVKDIRTEAIPIASAIISEPSISYASHRQTESANINKIDVQPWFSIKNKKSVGKDSIMLQNRCLLSLYKCMAENCCYFTSSSDRFAGHLTEHATENLQCAYCKFRADGPLKLLDHIMAKHLYDKFQCQHCFYRSAVPGNVVIHSKEYHKGKSQLVLVNREKEIDINLELKKIKVHNIKFVRPIVCFACDERFYGILNYKHHLNVHGPTTRMATTCRICNIVVNLKSVMGHLKKCFKIDEFQCMHCSKSTSVGIEMNLHLANEHSNQLPAACWRNSQNQKPDLFDSLQIITFLPQVKPSERRECQFLSHHLDRDEIQFTCPVSCSYCLTKH